MQRLVTLWAACASLWMTAPVVGAAAPAAQSAPGAVIEFDTTDARTGFAAHELQVALLSRRIAAELRGPAPTTPAATHATSIRFAPRDSLAPEEFAIERDGKAIVIASSGGAGAMYGGLELAEQIRLKGIDGVTPMRRKPYMSMRGVKFNLPLDLRTPSYSDMSDSAQRNIGTVWDLGFWHDYLDRLARDRYNFVSLWNLHPFPSMVRVPEFPEVALNDVWRSNARFDEDYSTRTTDIVTPAMLAGKTVVKRLTIDEKIAFWRAVMQYAADRNIGFYVVTWNVYTYGVDGKYGITDSIDNATTRDYFRASVREMFRAYPLLRGIGLTVGENMGEADFQAKENWALATYGQGVLDAAREAPRRPLQLIHRQHEARAPDIASTFAPVIAQPNVEFLFSFKYAQAHALSSTTQTFHREFVESLGARQTLWTIRNDDALLLRWAAPDFVRDFVRNIPLAPSRGFYLGSDMWVWGREFLSKRPSAPRALEIDKHWLHFLLWGRLGFDPSLDDERIAALVGRRFAGVDGHRLLAAWQDASMVYPLVTGFHWADFDFQWYIEACRSRPAPARTDSGFHSVETFITQRVHPGTDNVAIPAYVAALAKGGAVSGTTPPMLADRIDARADTALATVRTLAREPHAARNGELADTLRDIESMALLGKYYAAKIRGATELALFRDTKDAQHRERSVRHLGDAAKHWNAYVARVRAGYESPIWTNRVGTVDWDELSAAVRKDVEIAQAAAP